jgi:molecular chaperone GrpE
MSEPTAARVVGDVAANGTGSALSTEEIAELLADFRLWLMDAAQAPAKPPAPAETVDLITLVGQFTALRQEVNLQTKAVRSQQEQGAETLRQNEELLQSLQMLADRQDAAKQQELEAALRPLLQALIDVADAQMLTLRELTRTAQAVVELLPKPTEAPQAAPANETNELPPAPRGGFLGRLFGIHRLADYQRELAAYAQSRQLADESALPSANAAEQIGRILESALAGLAMGLQRTERAMRQFELESIQAVGRPFDAERMEAVEVISNSNQPAGEVIDELRRGYMWKGKVFRFAQVRVAK